MGFLLEEPTTEVHDDNETDLEMTTPLLIVEEHQKSNVNINTRSESSSDLKPRSRSVVRFTEPVLPVSPLMSPTESASSPTNEFGQILGEMQCPICLDCYDAPVSLQCGHTICKVHVAELSAILHHPDTGIIEFDCPKCRERCKFDSASDVKVNLEMKNLIQIVKKAAFKSPSQRRSEREAKLVARLKEFEGTTADLRRKEQRVEQDRRKLSEEKKKIESFEEQTRTKAETEKLVKGRQRLEREKKALEQQRIETNKQLHALMVRQAREGKAQQQQPTSGVSTEADIIRIKKDFENKKLEERRIRDERINAEYNTWMQQNDQMKEAFHSRLELQSQVDKFVKVIDEPNSSPIKNITQSVSSSAASTQIKKRVIQQKSSDPSYEIQFDHSNPAALLVRKESRDTLTDNNNKTDSIPTALVKKELHETGDSISGDNVPDKTFITSFSKIRNLPIAELSSSQSRPVEVQKYPGRVNPITGFPDVEHMLEIDGGDQFVREREIFSRAVKEVPPQRVPSDYPNHLFKRQDVDYELNDLLEEVDNKYRPDLEAAYSRKVLSEKARIAEERALSMVSQYKTNAGIAVQKPKRLKPSYQPKLCRARRGRV